MLNYSKPTCMKVFLLPVALCLFITTAGQDEKIKDLQNQTSKNIKKDPADTIPKTWKKGGIYGLNVAQGSLNNWAAGGEDFSISVNSLLSLFAFYKKDDQIMIRK